jgi:phosphotriesterase-related protein
LIFLPLVHTEEIASIGDEDPCMDRRGQQSVNQAVRTVRGDIAPAQLGVCNSHDHLFIRTPQMPGQEVDDTDAARIELDAFAALGGRAVVQWTPWGMGRRTAELAALSRASDVHLVSATGVHQARHYDPAEPGPG